MSNGSKMEVESYISELQARGHRITVLGADLEVDRASELSHTDREFIRNHKHVIRAALGVAGLDAMGAPKPAARKPEVKPKAAPISSITRIRTTAVAAPRKTLPRREIKTGRFIGSSAQITKQNAPPAPQIKRPGSVLDRILYGDDDATPAKEPIRRPSKPDVNRRSFLDRLLYG